MSTVERRMEVRPATGRTMSIVKAVLRFVGIAITTYLGLLAVTFFIGRVVPIDPVLAILGDRAPAHVIERVRRELGLDLPLYEQFYIYLKGVLSGDFGTSVLTTNPVMTDIRRAFPATLELATLGTIIGSVIGVPLGVLAAVRRGSLIDQLVRVIGLVGYSVPIFWMALISLVIFYAKLKWVAFPGRIDITYEYTFTPITGLFLLDSALQGEWDVFADVFRHIILPASLLGYFSLAYISRMTRSFMLNELGQEYIVAVRAKGLSETRVIWAHALRNAAVPLVTVIALSYAGLLEGSVLTETVFSWPGIGFYITNSLQNADMNAVLGGTIVIGTVFIGINLLSDILYRTLDPRTRRQ
ncbi:MULTISPECIES: ABC transporter permease [unclassified Rhizobium]|uniref:ABC transporter permease n=1 Tax=unclassified Rhizobium TaxID=2613769 RepID=UPI001AD97B42|nr:MULTISPECIES: ABC transporter permease [unclassified Rhizobium]MBO9100293.1 ABC transporter permease [Rhizobium sp. L58/93]MBO9135549.1 ABC transporter permease [Rhizobium sp. B209b/85]MBO9170259.1 ABC transporter permease [Rhizobium sp. L245/93]MBO9186186.1 ABC transporter permease [Rhizobium sp. E27B/91]QXZ83108.1 ABC transporter permease [Rhizobium sp. K1/93]